MGSRSKLRCDECTVPVAERWGDNLVIRQKHHGREHITLISIPELLEEAQTEQSGSAESNRKT